MRSATRTALVVLLGGLAVPIAASQQTQKPTAPARPTLPSTISPAVSGATLVVYLRTQDGQPLPEMALPQIRIVSAGVPLPTFPSRLGDGWVFSGLRANYDYDIEVTASGYVPGHERASIPDVGGGGVSVIIFLRPGGQELAFRPPAGQFVLAPKAAKEIERAVNDLESGHIAPAQKHAQKALKLAPGNPYVQYVMGVTYLLPGKYAQAKPYFEASVSMNPKEAPPLSALGTVRYRLGDYSGAIEVLSRAVQLDPKSWKSEWVLAASYLQERRYAEARDHARRALKIDGEKAGEVRLLLGHAEAGMGDREAAIAEFEGFANQFPKDPKAGQARGWAKMLKEAPVRQASAAEPETVAVSPLPVAPSASAASLVPPAPPPEIPPRPDWAPPDVDAAKPFLISNATCSLQQVLRKAGEKAEQFVRTLQEFSAVENFQEIELKRGGGLENPSEHDFEYLVFVDRPSAGSFNVREYRQRGSQERQLPGRIQDLGAPALALAFHPAVQPGLEWTCEGLGTWADQAAWVIRFEQDPAAPNILSRFYGPSRSYPLPLKGRAWVSERTGQVLHLDTDLVNAIQPIDLKRQHFSIDYAPVSFRERKLELWLPKTVDAYIQFEGHFLHYYHRYSNFRLFWVGTTEKVDLPKVEVEQQ